jgi:hypothetical protein
LFDQLVDTRVSLLYLFSRRTTESRCIHYLAAQCARILGEFLKVYVGPVRLRLVVFVNRYTELFRRWPRSSASISWPPRGQ